MNNLSQQQIHRRRRPLNFTDRNSTAESTPTPSADLLSHRRPTTRHREFLANSNFYSQPVVSLDPSKPTFSADPSSSCTQLFDEMAYGDRTQEFRTISKNMQLKVESNQPKPKVNRMLAESATFNQYARKIGSDLSQTFAKLEKLTLMVQKRSIFEAERVGSEIDELTQMIKSDINGLNRQIAQLQNFMNSGTAKNGLKNQSTSHSKSVVLGLQSKLVSMSNEFKTVLEVRTENLKHQKSRREKLGGGASSHVPSNLPVSASTGRLGSILLADEYSASHGNVVLEIGENPPQSQMLTQSQVAIADQQGAYLRSRADAMQNIESTIVDLGQIFSQLAHMVQEQGEMVQRIDSHVEETSLNVEAAHMQLLRYMHSISSNRWLAVKVFAVLIVFFIIFIVFLV